MNCYMIRANLLFDSKMILRIGPNDGLPGTFSIYYEKHCCQKMRYRESITVRCQDFSSATEQDNCTSSFSSVM